MHERIFILFSGWSSFLLAFCCLVRLCIPADWPVIIKYDRWEYGLKVFFGSAWFAWAMLILYWKY